MKFRKNKKNKKDANKTGIKSLKLETDISKLLNILQKKFGKSKGGIIEILKLATGGMIKDYTAGGNVTGPGTETSDDIPAMLSDGEFVITAKAVKNAGGSKPMYDMMKHLESGGILSAQSRGIV